MKCNEDARLKGIYDSALRVWRLSRESLASGAYTPAASSRLRKELLAARTRASNELYEHSQQCAQCRKARHPHPMGVG